MIAIRHRGLLAIANTLRNYSTEGKLVNVSMNEKTGIATVTMQRQPVNGLNLELLSELSTTLSDLDNNKTRGMILTSASKTVFSAGLDITEMYKPDPVRVKQFWITLQETWIKLYGSSFPTAAAINGHSPAGGCLLAMSCEYRVMLNNFTIGLNETQLGIIAPFWFISTMKNTISNREAEIALTTGRLLKTEEALKIGLVDETANDKAEAIQKCENFFKRFARVPALARSFTKASLRKNDIEALVKNQKQDLEMFLSFVNEPKVQKNLEMYLQVLKQKTSV